MKPLNASAMICALFVLGTAATTGCAVETAASEPEIGESADALAASKVKLPAGDPCREVLAPLALGIVESSQGLAYTSSITVSLTSETEVRLYTVSSTGTSSEPPIRHEVELDN